MFADIVHVFAKRFRPETEGERSTPSAVFLDDILVLSDGIACAGFEEALNAKISTVGSEGGVSSSIYIF